MGKRALAFESRHVPTDGRLTDMKLVSGIRKSGVGTPFEKRKQSLLPLRGAAASLPTRPRVISSSV